MSGPAVLAGAVAPQTGVALADQEALVLVGHTIVAADVADVRGAGRVAALADSGLGDGSASASGEASARVGVTVSAADRAEFGSADARAGAGAGARVAEDGIAAAVAGGKDHARSGGAVAARSDSGHRGRALEMAGALVGDAVRATDDGGLAEALAGTSGRAGGGGDVGAARAEDGGVVRVSRVARVGVGLALASVEDALAVALQFANAVVGDAVGSADDGDLTLALLAAGGGVLGSGSGSEEREEGSDSNLVH